MQQLLYPGAFLALCSQHSVVPILSVSYYAKMIFLLYYLSCGAVLAQEVDVVPEIDPFAGINEETDWNVFDQERG